MVFKRDLQVIRFGAPARKTQFGAIRYKNTSEILIFHTARSKNKKVFDSFLVVSKYSNMWRLLKDCILTAFATTHFCVAWVLFVQNLKFALGTDSLDLYTIAFRINSTMWYFIEATNFAINLKWMLININSVQNTILIEDMGQMYTKYCLLKVVSKQHTLDEFFTLPLQFPIHMIQVRM